MKKKTALISISIDGLLLTTKQINNAFIKVAKMWIAKRIGCTNKHYQIIEINDLASIIYNSKHFQDP